ncbi:MAG: alpha/beta hydrolase [Burkholderiaceae bacterium]|nr:alpha/beta hydrolase [Burkholderiaceae bacterium]
MDSHRSSRSRYATIRGLRYHLREWGPADAPAARRLVMLHGWMDVSASFQFVVDALDADWHVIAPDWRGFGLSERTPGDCYWFPDYIADLEYILDAVQADAPVRLVGHSMGGNVAMLYAGVRPARVDCLVNLEGVGLHASSAEQAPRRFGQWLDELKAGASLRDYADLDEVAKRLRQNNPRLLPDRAAFLARHWAEPDGAGRFRVAGDPAHRIVNPMLYRIEEAMACWRAIRCPALMVLGTESDVLKHVAGDRERAQVELARRFGAVPGVEQATIKGAGHMLHHDQPDAVARLIADFLARRR